MGQAKARGTREQRIAQAVERRKAEEVAANERAVEATRIKHETVRNLPPEQKRELLLLAGGGGHHATALLAMLLASSGARVPGMPLIAYEKPDDIDSSPT